MTDHKDDEALDRGLEAAFGDGPPPITRTATGITRRAGTSQGPPSVVDLVEQRTGRATRLLLKEEDSEHGASPLVRTSGTTRGRGSSQAGGGAHEAVPTGKGNYQIMGEIARGGMGAVLRGHDTDLGRDVAMKVLLEQHADSDSILQRFVEEAQIGGQLQHPGIVPVYELGLLDDDRPYFTMKLVKGRTLAALFTERSQPGEDTRRFLTIFEQVCQTIAYAHARKVIHRDLKPANIMVGAFGEVQVVDWGLAKVLQEGGIADERRAQQQSHVSIIETVRSVGSTGAGSQSLVGSVMGTPAYMSPEQAQGEVERLDERTDVFSLGAILAEILTGRPAYTGEQDSPVAEAARALQDKLHERLDACPAAPELVDLARRCLAPGKELRPRHAAALAKELNDYLASSEERAREAELAAAEARVRAVQERKARRLTLALAATVLLGVVGASLGYLHLEQQAADQRSATDQRRLEVNTKVRGILQDAQLRRGMGDYAAALVALDQADTVLSATSDATADLAPAVEGLRSDVLAAQIAEQEQAQDEQRLGTFLERLEDIQLNRGGGNDDDVAERRDQEYQQAFAAYDVSVFEGEENSVAAQLRATGHSLPVALALDEWARIKLNRFGFGTPEFGRLIRMAKEVDPDPWRLKLRNAVLADDRRALESIASAEETHSWPPETVVMFVESVADLGHDLDVIPLLRASHLRHPTHHIITYVLARRLSDRGDLAEALTFTNTTHALRPGFGRAILLQLHILSLLHRWDEMTRYFISKRDLLAEIEDDDWMTTWLSPRLVDALAVRKFYDPALALLEASLPDSPDPTMEHNNLAWYIATRNDGQAPDMAKALHHAEALVALEDSGNAYNTLSTVHYQSGQHREALDAIKTSMEKSGGGEEFDWLLTAMILKQLGVHDQADLWYQRASAAPPTPGRTRRNPFLTQEELEMPSELDVFRDRAREMFRDTGS